MRQILLLSILLSLTNFFRAQEKQTNFPIEKNTIYAEAFGQGLCWSMNYDRLLNTDKKVFNSFTVGVVYVPKQIQFGDGSYFGVPVSYNWLFGKKSHHLELGVGITGLASKSDYGSTTINNFYTYLTPKIGYRFQRPQGGFFLKVTATPMIDLVSFRSQGANGSMRISSLFSDVAGLGYPAFPWPGFSIGYTFK